MRDPQPRVRPPIRAVRGRHVPGRIEDHLIRGATVRPVLTSRDRGPPPAPCRPHPQGRRVPVRPRPDHRRRSVLRPPRASTYRLRHILAHVFESRSASRSRRSRRPRPSWRQPEGPLSCEFQKAREHFPSELSIKQPGNHPAFPWSIYTKGCPRRLFACRERACVGYCSRQLPLRSSG